MVTMEVIFGKGSRETEKRSEDRMVVLEVVSGKNGGCSRDFR